MKYVVTALAVLLLASAAPAADQTAGETCPAHRAAEAGFNPFELFHEVVAPAWHNAWPAKDYDALLAAGPKFVSAMMPVAEMKPTFKSALREQQFIAQRTELANVVQAYADAAAAGDKEKVYELMPALHDAFELTAATLLPVNYPQFEGMVVTVNMILETHLPKNNTEGIIGSTETLTAKLSGLTGETLPEELVEHKAAIEAEFSAMNEIAGKMKACCEQNDMAGYQEHITALDAKIRSFIQLYI